MGACRLLFRGQRELRAGDARAALATLGRAAARRPTCPHAALHHALAMADAGALDDALAALAAAADKWPANPVFPLFRGALLAEAGRLDGAAAALEQASGLSPGNRLADAYRGVVELQRGELERPLRRLAAGGFTDNSRALAALMAQVEAALFERFGPDTDGSRPRPLPESELPAGLRRASAERLAALGRKALERGDAPGAQALLKLAAQKNPSLPDVFALLGFAAYDLGRHAEALDLLARAGHWAKPPEAIHLHRGAALYKLGRLPEALEALRAAEAADTLGDYTAWIQLFIARVLVAQGQVAEARAPLRRLIEAEGDLALARLRQARELLGLALPASAPQGYEVIEEGRTVLVARPAYAGAIRETASGLRPPASGPPAPTGRAPMQRIALPDGGAALVRTCRRGGLLGGLLGDRHFDGNRFVREIAVSDALRRRGLPTPELIAGIRRETFPGVYRAEIIVREIPDALDLAAALRALPECGTAAPSTSLRAGLGCGAPPPPTPEGGRATQPDPARVTRHAARDGTYGTYETDGTSQEPSRSSPHASRVTHHAALAAAATLLRRLHDAGLYHPDLNARNILICADGSAMIIDLDRAELLDELPLSDRLGNLARLYRSFHKLGLAPEPVSDAAWGDFYAAYAAGDAALLAEADALLARCRRQLRRHRLWWRLAGRK